jgi:mannosylglycerate hydrolase
VAERPAAVQDQPLTAVVVPHTHWDREWYAPFETMRFHLVRFLDELVDVLEGEPDLPVFLLDGQAVILDDYLEVRGDQRERVAKLVAAGRLRPGPHYVQPDEFHASGEALVRNLLVGCQVAGEYGWAMREGYLPDTFGHVHQLPQILAGFGIETFYAMRGFGLDAEAVGDQFWWEATDGSRVLVQWLSESYSNAAVLAGEPDEMALHHGTLVRYDSLSELLDRLSARSPTGVLLLLNGGDHLRVQEEVVGKVRSLSGGVPARLRLGGLEEFHELVLRRARPQTVVRGELRYGRTHDVFEGIGSTRTPMKRRNERTEALLCGLAERLDALATQVDGVSSRPSLRHAWRELVKNYAHDSICGCSVDEVHEEMDVRFRKVAQVARTVAEDAAARIAAAAAPEVPDGTVPVVVVNPSAYPRGGEVSVAVCPDLDVPVGERRYGWTQGTGVDWAGYELRDAAGEAVPFTVTADAHAAVVDPLNRRKEVRRDTIRFTVGRVPALDTALYRLVPAADPVRPPIPCTRLGPRTLDSGTIRVEVAEDATLTLTDHRTGRTLSGLLEILDDGDAGDEYGFGALSGDQPVSSRAASWTVDDGPDGNSLTVTGSLDVPVALADDRRTRSAERTGLPVELLLRLGPGSDRVEVTITVHNTATDHRLRARFGTGLGAGESIAESAFGTVRRRAEAPHGGNWREPPSGVSALRRFVAVQDDRAGLQMLAEGLHEYACDREGTLDVTLLRSVGWLARTDHPRRPHKVGPQLPTPGAQCLGRHEFRLTLRPYQPEEVGAGHLYRAAEEFSVPLYAHAAQGTHPGRGSRNTGLLGLSLSPQAVVLSAVKTADDGDGIVVRFFNADDHPVTATVRTGVPLASAQRCNLEERPVQAPLATGGELTVPLAAGEIATLRLHVGGER